MLTMSKAFCLSPLGSIIDGIWDIDLPEGDVAKTLIIRHAPGNAVFLIAPYKGQYRSNWMDLRGETSGKSAFAMTRVLSGIVDIYPQGSLGLVVAALKPEAASRILSVSMRELDNQCSNIFNDNKVSLFAEMLSEARNSSERKAIVQNFVLGLAGRMRPDSVECLAAATLSSYPNVRLPLLAGKLNIGERQLRRRFKATFGMGPKLFARLSRIENVLETRFSGADFNHLGGLADVAYACGFADQAHMTRDFKTVIGDTPEKFFGTSSVQKVRSLNASLWLTCASHDQI
jgi:AraC-like DNA-binding protein